MASTAQQYRPASVHNTRALNLWLGLLISVCGAIVAGCDSTGDALSEVVPAPESPKRLVSTATSPRVLIEQCVRAYQRLSSYADDGLVRLRYELDGQLLEDQAPLSVAWDQRGQVGLKVYTVQAGPTAGRWRLRLRDEDDPFAQQVLSRALPAKVNFPWLLSDPVVAERLSAGLAGFPPQLDLLLDERPLSGLIDDSVALSFGAPESIDGRACFVVKIARGPDEYVMWIDQATLLLRRMRLPNTRLTEQMLADQRVSKVELTIEFVNVRTDEAIDWQRFEVPISDAYWLVQRFVPRRVELDTSNLGEQIPGFQLQSPSGQTVYNASQSRAAKRATVLMWVADHPTCRVACEQLQRVAQSLQSAGLPSGSVEFVTVWAEPQPPAGSTFDTLSSDWGVPGQLALDRQALGRDLFGVTEAPTLIVLDAQHRLQLRQARSNPLLDQFLPDLLNRLVRGEDLARQTIREQSRATERFEAELQMAAASDAHLGAAFPNLKAYEPQTFRLREFRREHLSQPAIAVGTDATQAMWLVLSNGQLQRISEADNSASAVNFKTTWKPELRAGQRLEIGPEGEHLALCSIGGKQIALHHLPTQQSRVIQLDEGSKIVDARWLKLGSSGQPRLSAVTRDGQIVVIDPANREQLSGRSSTQPLALLCSQDLAPISQAGVVMAQGTIEELQLSRDLASAAASVATASAGTQTLPAPAAQAQAAERLKQLAFQPAEGPWVSCRQAAEVLTLARGWLGTDEPAVFMLDSSLRQRWHFRMPLQASPAWSSVCAAQDPSSGQAMWAISAVDHRVYVLRSDGLIIDHFLSEVPVVGLSLRPNGPRLELTLVHPDERVHYAIEWLQP